MPRNISRRLFGLLNGEGLMPIDLIDITPLGANETIRLTNAGESVTWNGNTYYRMNLSRGASEEIAATDSGKEPSFTVSIQNVDLQMGALIAQTNLDGALVVVRMADRRLLTNPRDAMIITQGEARDFQVSETIITFSIWNTIGILENVTVPRRIYQMGCNYAFGSQACGVDRSASPFTVSTTALAGTTDQAIVVDPSILALADGDDPSDFWEAGDIIVAGGGAATLQARPIQSVDRTTNTFYVRFPFATSPVGATCYVRRGCPHTKVACQVRQPTSSADNYGGFEEVPFGTIAPVIINPK